MQPIRTLAGAALLAVLVAQPSWGQGLLHYLQDPDPNRSLGPSVARIGDVDLDGTEDFAICGKVFPTQLQFVRVCSGRDASTLFEIPPGSFVYSGPLPLAGLGDIDGDGVPDLAIGDEAAYQNGVQPGAVSLHSGVDGSVLQVLWGQRPSDLFGSTVAGAGDVDGDGWPDVIVGARQSLLGDPGYVEVFSGATGELLHHWTGDVPLEYFGLALDGAGDVDGDGHADVVVGSGLESETEVWVFSGKDGSVLQVLDAGAAASSVAGGRDLDGDSVPDIVAGAANWSPPGMPSAGRILAWSGADWSLLFDLPGRGEESRLGCALDLIDDIDGDGLTDVLAAAYEYPTGLKFAGVIYSFSSQTQLPLLSVQGEGRFDCLGCQPHYLAALGDLDADGLPEFGAGVETFWTGDGYVPIRSTTVLSPLSYCSAKPNSLGCESLSSWTGTPSLSGSDNFVVSCAPALNQQLGILRWSESPKASLFLGGFLCLGKPRYTLGSARSGGSPTGVDCTGVLSFPLTKSAMLAQGMTAGMTVCVQWFYRDPLHPDGTSAALSNGLRFSVLP